MQENHSRQRLLSGHTRSNKRYLEADKHRHHRGSGYYIGMWTPALGGYSRGRRRAGSPRWRPAAVIRFYGIWHGKQLKPKARGQGLAARVGPGAGHLSLGHVGAFLFQFPRATSPDVGVNFNPPHQTTSGTSNSLDHQQLAAAPGSTLALLRTFAGLPCLACR